MSLSLIDNRRDLKAKRPLLAERPLPNETKRSLSGHRARRGATTAANYQCRRSGNKNSLWQKAGRVSVVAGDGTELEPYVNPRLIRLPLVVGLGAAVRAKEFLALLDRYPDLRDQVRASVLISERRWNLRLRNGLDIRLPETDVEQALAMLVALDRDKKLLSRDIVAVDLRLPDRVTVRLSEAAAAARAEALKDKKPAKKGGNA